MAQLNNIFNNEKQKELFDKTYNKKEKVEENEEMVDGYKFAGINNEGYKVYIGLKIGELPENRQTIVTLQRIDKKTKRIFIKCTVKVKEEKIEEIVNKIKESSGIIEPKNKETETLEER